MKIVLSLRLIRSHPRFGLITGFLTALAFLAISTDLRAYTNSVDTPDALNAWVHWWGAATTTRQFDPTTDADGNPNSGSMRVSANFSRSYGADNQLSIWGSFSGTPNSWGQPLDGTSYSALEMDILWDPFSPTIPATGNYSSDFHYGFAVGDPVRGQIDFTNHLVITPSDIQGWIHLSMPLNPLTIGTNLTNIVGVWIKMWTGDNLTNSLEDGEVAFWVDNIRLRAAPPPPPDYTNTFDTASSLTGWVHWWGGIMETREFDPNMDADGNPNSGSMKVTVPYNRANSDNQFSMWGSFSGTPNSWQSPLNGTLYTNLEMDVYWDPGSATRPATGDYGNDFRYGFAIGATNYGQIQFSDHTVIAPSDVGHWFHLSYPIDLASISSHITNIVGVWIKMWTGNNPTQSLSGTTIFWVDNVRMRVKARNAPPPPPPTLSIERPTPPGLRLFASAPGIEHQRQNIRTLQTNFSWVGATGPVTYAVTISAYPAVDSFQTHIFLVPGDSIPPSPDPDYAQPNCVFLDIRGNANGSAYAVFRYKTNEPAGNNFLYGVGSIARVESSTILGTWNLTFNPNGAIALTSPSGANTNFTMPAEAVGLFNAPLRAYFGIQPNLPANIGLSATLGRVRITGVATPIDEGFSSAMLDPAVWEVSAQQPTGVVPVPPDALFWLSWTLPDAGFTPQTTFSLPGEWSDLTLSDTQIGPRKRILILPSSLPVSDTGNYFFRMRRP